MLEMLAAAVEIQMLYIRRLNEKDGGQIRIRLLGGCGACMWSSAAVIPSTTTYRSRSGCPMSIDGCIIQSPTSRF